MAQSRRTSMLSGYFDCRIFRQGVAKENRQMKPEGDTISFSVGFSEYPKEFAADGGEQFIRETEVNGLKRWYVTFKVGRICAFFDKDGKRFDTRPTNDMLDGKRFDAVIQYKTLNGDASKMQPRGFWADAIQIKPAEEITFAPMDGAQVQQAVTTEAPTDDEPSF